MAANKEALLSELEESMKRVFQILGNQGQRGRESVEALRQLTQLISISSVSLPPLPKFEQLLYFKKSDGFD